MNKGAGIGIGEVLMLIGASMILGWALLKGFGIINTPLLIQVVPYVGGAVSVFGVVLSFTKMINKIDGNGRQIREVSGKLGSIERSFIEVRNNQVLCLNGKLNGSPYVK